MNDQKNLSAPIGVFDYGIGGLTVVKALSAALPNEHFVFLADEAKVNTPEEEEPARLHRTEDALRYASFLQTQHVKMIVVGCNLMSAFAMDTLRQKLDIPVIGLVEPAIAALAQTLDHPETKKAAVFTTEMAAYLHLFTRKLQAAFPGISVTEIGCGKLPALISSGLADSPAADQMVREYAVQAGADLDAALLTCTRFPVLMRSFERALPGIPILDPAQTLPQLVTDILDREHLHAPADTAGTNHFYTTGDAAVFEQAAAEILGTEFPFSAAHSVIQ